MAHLSANAVVPDQLVPYVAAVSGLETELVNGCALHHAAGHAVLVAYPEHDPFDHAAAARAVELAQGFPGLEKLTVLSARRPVCVPDYAATIKDMYWQIGLPDYNKSSKLANMLRRAQRDLEISKTGGKGAWTSEHKNLQAQFCKRKSESLDAGSVYLFERLGAYLDAAPEAVLFTARRRDSSLAGLAIGDFTALGTAFYMFAFRSADAPPGTADLLLHAIVEEARQRGHIRVNLGLGINAGIEFFKRKWGASQFLPYVETSWQPGKAAAKDGKGWFRRIFANWTKS